MLDGAERIVVHDHWTSYFQMPGVTHALCNAHNLRELNAVAEIDREAWAGRMRRLLRRLWRPTNQARDRDVALPPPLIA
jgi:transposase